VLIKSAVFSSLSILGWVVKSHMDVILTLDAGTTGVTTTLYSKDFQILHTVSIDFPQHFPSPGFVEHDLTEIKQAFTTAIQQLMKVKAPDEVIKSIGITNQRETIGFWDRQNGEPLCKAIVWQDRRTSDFCRSIRMQRLNDRCTNDTGLRMDPYFSGSKIRWALVNNKNVKSANHNGSLALGTIDTYLTAWLTGYKSYVTEPSNASRTMLYNIRSLKWDDFWCKTFLVNKNYLPKVIPSNSSFGVTSGLGFLPDGIPITGILGDQQAALLGQNCTISGMVKCTYGTGAFVLLNTGEKIKRSRHKLLSTVAWQLDGKKPYYALEGSAFVAGSAVQWLRDELKLVKHSYEIEALALRAKPEHQVVFVPALAGLGAPEWSPASRGAFFGLTRGTSSADLACATLEGIALTMSALFQALSKDSHLPLRKIRVDGGATENGLLMQLQADYAGVTIERPRSIESTSLGAAKIAALGLGWYKSLRDLEKRYEISSTFKPKLPKANRAKKMGEWKKAIQAVRTFAGDV